MAVHVRSYPRRSPAESKFIRRNPHEVAQIRHPGQKRLQPYLKYSMGDYHRFEKVPPSLAETLLTGYPLVDPKETQNDGPTMRQMIGFAQANFGTLEGYIIEAGKRSDARITFDGMTLDVVPAQARQLQRTFGEMAREADEFDPASRFTPGAKGYRFWWD